MPKTTIEIIVDAGVRHAIKLAFGEQEAGRVLAAFKSKKLPKAAYKALAHPAFAPAATLRKAMPIAALPTGSQAVRSAGRFGDLAIGQLASAGHGSDVIEGAKRYLKSQKDFIKHLPKGGAVWQREPVSRVLEHAGADVSRLKTPAQKKMLEAVVKGHELAETQVRPSMAFKPFMHNSPDVLLREHNMITTLPKKYEEVGEVMRGLRTSPVAGTAREGDVFRESTGLAFGKGQRLSRHARKRIVPMMEQRMGSLAAASPVIQKLPNTSISGGLERLRRLE